MPDLLTIVVVGVSILVFAPIVLWLLHLLRTKYPETQNDPAMAGVGGLAAFLMVIMPQTGIPAPFMMLVPAIPIAVVMSFISTDVPLTTVLHCLLAVGLDLGAAALVYWQGFPGSLLVGTIVTVFFVQWGWLFYWRYMREHGI